MAKEIVCTRCLYEGKPARKTPGSFAIEIVLWLLFCVPGLIYSIWRLASAYEGCPKCGAKEIVPTDSAAARRLRREGE